MSDTKKRSLLLVEDDVVIAFAEKRWLKEYGYDVIHISNGRDSVDSVLSGKIDPDLILMDINLGEGLMDGTEAARLILEEKDLPIVFLSSHTEPEIVARTESITSYGYVVKDSGITVLDASIKMAFRLFESRRREKEKDQALVESEMRLRRAMDGSKDGLWDWNLLNDEAYFSERFSDMLGYEPGELPSSGKALCGLIHPDDREKTFEVLHNYLDRKSEVYEAIFRMKTKSGDYRWIVGRGKAVWDDEGKPLRITGTNTDVTEVRHSRAALLIEGETLFNSLFGDAFRNTKEGVIIAESKSGRITFANPRACRMFGFSRDEFIALSIPDLHEPGFFPGIFPLREILSDIRKLSETFPVVEKTGKSFTAIRLREYAG